MPDQQTGARSGLRPTPASQWLNHFQQDNGMDRIVWYDGMIWSPPYPLDDRYYTFKHRCARGAPTDSLSCPTLPDRNAMKTQKTDIES
jgi:hypothetical protein